MSILFEKREGETPLQALGRLRAGRPELSDAPLTYAGRLDPMASGKLLVLVGDECKKRAEYDALDKEYEFEVLCGVSSDTGDILGLAEAHDDTVRETAMRALASSLEGRLSLPYPAYSSKTVNGTPLFQYALEGRLGEISIPEGDVALYALEYFGERRLPLSAVAREAIARLETFKPERTGKPGDDFRKPLILERWERLRKDERECVLHAFRARVSSGTYIRSLASLIAERLGTRGLAWSIRRTAIGPGSA